MDDGVLTDRSLGSVGVTPPPFLKGLLNVDIGGKAAAAASAAFAYPWNKTEIRMNITRKYLKMIKTMMKWEEN